MVQKKSAKKKDYALQKVRTNRNKLKNIENELQRNPNNVSARNALARYKQ